MSVLLLLLFYRSVGNDQEIVKVTQLAPNSGLLLAHLPMSIPFFQSFRNVVQSFKSRDGIVSYSCLDLLIYNDMGCYLGLFVLGGGQKVGNGKLHFEHELLL